MNDAMIVPHDRDWTWVLERPCPECGFDASTASADDVADLIRRNAVDWVAVLDAPAERLRMRPRPDRWSTLEYAVHVRDVHRLYLERLELMLDHDDPLFPNWDQDDSAVTQRYNEADPAAVANELVDAAHVLATAFERLAGDADRWGRRGRRSDGAAFTIDSFARYLVHDPIHHLWDVTQR